MYRKITRGGDTVSDRSQAKAKILHIIVIPREEGDDDY